MNLTVKECIFLEIMLEEKMKDLKECLNDSCFSFDSDSFKKDINVCETIHKKVEEYLYVAENN